MEYTCPHFRFSFLGKSELVPRKQGRWAEKASAGKVFNAEIPPASEKRGGPIGRPAGRPYNAITWFLGKEQLARPTQKMDGALWFLRATPLLPSLATPEILSILRLLGKK